MKLVNRLIKSEIEKKSINAGFSELLEYFIDWYDTKIAIGKIERMFETLDKYSISDVERLYSLRMKNCTDFKLNSLSGLYLTSLYSNLVKTDTDVIRADLRGSTLNYIGTNWSKGILEIIGDVGSGAAYRASGGLIYIKGDCGEYACQEMDGGFFIAKRIDNVHSDFINGIIVKDLHEIYCTSYRPTYSNDGHYKVRCYTICSSTSF